MNRFWGIGLFVVGTAGAVATWRAWTPCQLDRTTDACIQAMEAPANSGTMTTLWIAAVVLSVLAVMWGHGTGRLGAVVALGLVLLFNPITEYTVWAGMAGGDWGTPAGNGYSQSAAIIAAAVIVLVTHEVERHHVRTRATRAREVAAARAMMMTPLSS